LSNWKVVVGTLGRKGSGEKSMQRKRTRTKRGTDSIGACRCAALTGALPLQVQSLYRGVGSLVAVSRCPQKCLSLRTPFVPRARASCGNLRRPSVATVASSAASHRPFASSHMPRRHQTRRHARAVSQSPRASQILRGWVYVHVPLFAVLCLGSRAGSHPHCLVRSYVVSANSKCGVVTQDAAESMKSMRSW
jgi:hypothetical protein